MAGWEGDMKITKAQEKTRDQVIDSLRRHRETLDKAVETFNEAQREAFEKVKDQLADYNSWLEEARELRDEIVSDAESYIEGKSEKWQDSEKARAIEAFRDAWGEVDLDAVDVEDPEPLELDVTHHADEVESAVTESDA